MSSEQEPLLQSQVPRTRGSIVVLGLKKTWNFLSPSLETSREAWVGGGVATTVGEGIKWAAQKAGYKPDIGMGIVLHHLIPDACGAVGFAGVGQYFYFNHKAEENDITPAQYIQRTGEARKEIFGKFFFVGGVGFVVYTLGAEMMPWLQFNAVVNGVNLHPVINGVAAVGGGLSEFAALAYPMMGDFPLPKLLDIAGVFTGFDIGEQLIAPLLPSYLKPVAPFISAGVCSFGVNMLYRGARTVGFFQPSSEGQGPKLKRTGSIQEDLDKKSPLLEGQESGSPSPSSSHSQ